MDWIGKRKQVKTVNHYFSLLIRNRFARSVAVVASGTAAAQIITFLFAPVITRLYGPEAFGVLGTFNALLAVMAPIATLSYPIAIVLPKHDSEARGLARLSIRLGILVSTLTLFIVVIAENEILTLLKLESSSPVIWCVPLAMFLSALLATADRWAIRKKLFALKAKVTIADSLFQNLINVVLGFIAPLAWVLVGVATIGRALHAGFFVLGFKRLSLNKTASDDVSKGDGAVASELELARKHSDFAY